MIVAASGGANGADVELHGPGLAHGHCMWALAVTHWFELGLVHPKVRRNRAPIYADPQWLDLLESVDEQGCVAVPAGAGLGVELDWGFINERKTGAQTFE